VSYALPHALNNLNHDVRLIVPNYLQSKKYFKTHNISANLITSFNDYKGQPISIALIKYNGLKIYLVDHKIFHINQIYDDNQLIERFTLFSWVIPKLLDNIKWKPEIIHANDWPTAPVMAYVHQYREKHKIQGPATIFTIHNLAYQGNSPLTELIESGINTKYLQGLIDQDIDETIRYLRIGIKWCDRVTTVSETYAKEILTPEYGYGLEYDLKSHPYMVSGITHGIDTVEWDPENDKYVHLFSKENLQRKYENKIELQQKAKLKVDSHTFAIGIVSRLVYQKGIDLIAEIIPQLDNNIQLFILGTGEPQIEHKLKIMQKKFPDRFALFLEFDTKLSHQFFAGLDAVIIPSRYEPCGLTQLYAMRYGTIPIVRHTGGLADTVSEEENQQTGFLFQNYLNEELLAAIIRASDCYFNNQQKWIEIQKNCMNQDFSWEKPAKKWEFLQLNLIRSMKGNNSS
jgi:starch synthase